MAVSFILTATLLVALLSSLVLGFFLRWRITEESMPAKESEMGAQASIINLIYFIALIIIVTVAIVLLVKYGKLNVIRVFMVIVVALLIFSFTQFMMALYQLYIVVVLYFSGHRWVAHWIPYILPVSIVFVVLFMAIYMLSVMKIRYINARNFVLWINTIWAAVWFGWNSGYLTPILLLVGMAVYDLYSVFRGPLRELAELMTTDTEEEEAEDTGVIIGLGDIFFYSFLVAYSHAILKPYQLLVVMVVLFLGVLITFVLLFRYEVRALPALPIPVLLSVGFIILFMYLP